MRGKVYYLFAGILITFALLAFTKLDAFTVIKRNDLPDKVKSGNLAADYNVQTVLLDIEKMGLNTVNIPVLINIPSATSQEMTIDPTSKAKAVKLLKKLRGRGISIILEPYPWIQGGTIGETEWNPADHNLFFENWRNKVLKELLQDVAVPYRVAVMTAGSNLVHLEADQQQWIDTIQYIRDRFDGLVTYRTNWWSTAEWEPASVAKYEAKLNNPLFSKVDFISISAYFELTDSDTATVQDLAAALHETQIHGRKQNVYQQIKSFNDTWQKPVFFGELGFPKRKGALREPWNPQASNESDPAQQAKGFAAYRQVFKDEPWFLGFSVFAIGQTEGISEYAPGTESVEVIKGW